MVTEISYLRNGQTNIIIYQLFYENNLNMIYSHLLRNHHIKVICLLQTLQNIVAKHFDPLEIIFIWILINFYWIGYLFTIAGI